MSFKTWWHNLTHEPNDQIIECPYCKIIQRWPDWDYMICGECGKYVYDNREVF